MAERNTSSVIDESDDASDESDTQEEDEESLTEVASSSTDYASIQNYTEQWVEQLDRGGLYRISNECFDDIPKKWRKLTPVRLAEGNCATWHSNLESKWIKAFLSDVFDKKLNSINVCSTAWALDTLNSDPHDDRVEDGIKSVVMLADAPDQELDGGKWESTLMSGQQGDHIEENTKSVRSKDVPCQPLDVGYTEAQTSVFKAVEESHNVMDDPSINYMY
eukprot:Em0006g1389a